MVINLDPTPDIALARETYRSQLAQSARDLALDISRIETDEDKLSILMGLGALVAEVSALAAAPRC